MYRRRWRCWRWGCGVCSRMSAMQQAAEQGPANFPIGNRCRTLPSRGGKRGVFGLFARFIFAVMHLLDESLGLLLIGERQASGALFELERVKECTILVVREVIKDLLIPDHSPCGGLHQDHQSCQRRAARQKRPLTEISTTFSQNVRPTRSLQSTAAPWIPVYVHRWLSG